jgi:hypothetical protein
MQRIPNARLMPNKDLKIFAARIDNIPVRFYRENTRQYSVIVTNWEVGFMVNKNEDGNWEVVSDSPNNPLNKQVDFTLSHMRNGKLPECSVKSNKFQTDPILNYQACRMI